MKLHDALARRFAEFHASHDLLPDVASFFEVDAMQQIEIGLVNKGVAISKVGAALRYALGNAMRFKVFFAGARGALKIAVPCDDAQTHAFRPHVAIDDALNSSRRLVKNGSNANFFGFVSNCHIRPELVKIEPFDEVANLVLKAIDEIAAPLARKRNDEEIEQQLSLGRQKRGIPAFASRDIEHAVGNEPLQKVRGIRALHLDDTAILKKTKHCNRLSLDFSNHFLVDKRARARRKPFSRNGPHPMPQSFDLILKGGTVAGHTGIGTRDIGIRGGKIAALGDLSRASAGEVINATGLHILPGVIDTQVHFREPGLTHKEDFETGSRAAVLGGVTAVFEMPNTSPPTVSAEALADKMARAMGRIHCDYAFWAGGTAENWRDISELERLPGSAGIKVFMGSSTGSLLVAEDAGIAAILSQTRRRAAFHCEDENRLNARKDLRVPGDAASHPVWRDEEAAVRAVERLLRVAREKRAAVHVLHVSCGEEMELLAAHKDIASVEVTPHHLTLSAEDYARLGTRMQMNPPVRSARQRERLWFGVEQGIADILGSDHAPHTFDEKAKPYPGSPSGMPGVQTLVPIMLDHVSKGRLSLLHFADMTSAGPARLFGIAGKGRIAAGYDADFTIVDLKRRIVINNRWIASRCGWTPYEGFSVLGWPVGTIIRGLRVMWEGELAAPGQGQPVRFVQAL